MNVNNLLEGASPYQALQDQAGKLAGKWEKSGLLEGIGSATEQNNMAMLLENQAKQLVNEANTAGTGASFNAGNSEAWAGVALPLVRRVFGEIVAKDLVSVQPMNLPAGLIFYLDFQYGQAGNLNDADESLYGATADLKRTDGAFNKGLYGAGEYGYSINSESLDGIYGYVGTGQAGGMFAGGAAQFDGDIEATPAAGASGTAYGGLNDTDLSAWLFERDTTTNTINYANINDKFRVLMGRGQNMSDETGTYAPNLMISNSFVLSKFLNSQQSQQQFTSDADLRAGFAGCQFNGIPYVVDEFCGGSADGAATDNELYILSTNTFRMYYKYGFEGAKSPMDTLTMRLPNQAALSSQTYLVMNLVNIARRYNAVFTALQN